MTNKTTNFDFNLSDDWFIIELCLKAREQVHEDFCDASQAYCQAITWEMYEML